MCATHGRTLGNALSTKRENVYTVILITKRVTDLDQDHLRLAAGIDRGQNPKARKEKEKAKVVKVKEVNPLRTRRALLVTSSLELDVQKGMTANSAMTKKNSRSSRKRVAERIFSRAGPEPRGHYQRRYACHPQRQTEKQRR